MNRKKAGQEKNTGTYLEIYIEKDGRLIFTPLTKRTALVLKRIFNTKNRLSSIYCG
ncbi:MAG: hypothetical protein V2A64_03630 [Candidatus Omnitrophota bacterium]